VPMDTIFTKEDATLLAHQWRHMQIWPLLPATFVGKVVLVAIVMEVSVFHVQVGISFWMDNAMWVVQVGMFQTALNAIQYSQLILFTIPLLSASLAFH
jgi:hypothetical protein